MIPNFGPHGAERIWFLYFLALIIEQSQNWFIFPSPAKKNKAKMIPTFLALIMGLGENDSYTYFLNLIMELREYDSFMYFLDLIMELRENDSYTSWPS